MLFIRRCLCFLGVHRVPSARFALLVASVAAVCAAATLCLAQAAHADGWALLIGIDQYDDVNHINPLGGAAADARALAKTLQTAAGFPEDHIKVLVSDGEIKPTRTNILNELTRLSRNAKPGDTVFVLYSGHGVDIDGTPYLLPYDTSALSDADITDTALETSKFRARLRQVKAKALILAFDMCRSDPRKAGKDVTAVDNTMSHTLARGLDLKTIAADGGASGAETGLSSPIAVTLYSCTEGERSYEWQDKGRGYFSYYLEQGLRGAAADASGQVTIGSLAAYVGSHVKTEVEQAEHHEQTPYPSLDGPGAGDFVLAHGGVVVPVAGNVVVNTHARLQITVNAPNTAITVDGQALAAGQDYDTNLLTEPQKTVKVVVTAPGYDGQVLTPTLKSGETSQMQVTLVALPPPAVNPERPVIPPPSGGALAGGAIKVNPTDGAEMVFIPAGKFLMGDDDIGNNKRHTVTLSSGYFIYKNLVTVAMYRKFCDAKRKQMPAPPSWGWKDDHPIVNVSWDDAKAYCDWAGAKLPTEAQWERAARGTDGRKYPWGDEFDNSRLWSGAKGSRSSTAPVGSFPEGHSPEGVLDMSGNVWQWCADFYDEDSMKTDATDPTGPGFGESRVLRGGSWDSSSEYNFRAASRGWVAPAFRDGSNGFRCVVPAAGPP